jgi:protoporphyrinogen oxidase
MAETRVVILGGGPAGVGGAYALARAGRARVTLLEAQDALGGNAGSFSWEGQRLDFGSHRLHPATDPGILEDIRRLLGGELLDRPRHGRIRLRGRWIHFPLKPLDLALRLDPGFALGALGDAAARLLPGRGGEGDTFASVLQANLGGTICRDFYFPYARKIWGREPAELSGIQARRRVSAGSFAKLARKVLNAVPGMKPPGAGRFFYPRGGFGRISEAYADAATAAGAELVLGWRVTKVTREPGETVRWTVTAQRQEASRTWTAEHVWSTLPISLLARLTDPAPPPAVAEAAAAIDYRAMILVYLRLDVPRFTEFDAHYFPGADLAITRLSEPRNYADLPLGSHTVLCAELPASPGDGRWELDDAALGRLVAEDLGRAGLPLPRPPVGVLVRRLRQAYPIYTLGYEVPFGVLDAWADGLPNLLTYGRQGLFAHDNTHHALAMAYAAAECLVDGRFDAAQWARHRAVFATHVVED